MTAFAAFRQLRRICYRIYRRIRGICRRVSRCTYSPHFTAFVAASVTVSVTLSITAFAAFRPFRRLRRILPHGYFAASVVVSIALLVAARIRRISPHRSPTRHVSPYFAAFRRRLAMCRRISPHFCRRRAGSGPFHSPP